MHLAPSDPLADLDHREAVDLLVKVAPAEAPDPLDPPDHEVKSEL